MRQEFNPFTSNFDEVLTFLSELNDVDVVRNTIVSIVDLGGDIQEFTFTFNHRMFIADVFEATDTGTPALDTEHQVDSVISDTVLRVDTTVSPTFFPIP